MPAGSRPRSRWARVAQWHPARDSTPAAFRPSASRIGSHPATLNATSGERCSGSHGPYIVTPGTVASPSQRQRGQPAGVLADRVHGLGAAARRNGDRAAEVAAGAGRADHVDREPQRLRGDDHAEDVRGAGRVFPGQIVVADVIRRDLSLRRSCPRRRGTAASSASRCSFAVQHADTERRQDLVEGERQVVHVQRLRRRPGCSARAARRRPAAATGARRPAAVAAAVGNLADRGAAVASCRGNSTPRCSRRAWSGSPPATADDPDRAARCHGRTGRVGIRRDARTAAGSPGTVRTTARNSSCAPSSS